MKSEEEVREMIEKIEEQAKQIKMDGLTSGFELQVEALKWVVNSLKKYSLKELERHFYGKEFDEWFCREYRESSSSLASVDDFFEFLKEKEAEKE